MTTKNCNCKDSTIVEGIFDDIYNADNGNENEDFFSLSGGDGEISSTIVKSYTLTNSNRAEVILITWGASIISLKCPDKYGRPADIVLGFDDLKSYMNPRLNEYFGCVLGRCANRIKNGSFKIKDTEYQLSLNENYKHHLHGGLNGFGRQIWESCIDGCTVVMSHMSEDSQEGYPGAVLATLRFKLTPDNRLEIGMRATTSKSTIINLSHGSLFNLAGHDAGEEELMKHRVSLNCDRWTFTNLNDPVPTGAIRGVGGTVMDLRIPRLLGDTINAVIKPLFQTATFQLGSREHFDLLAFCREIHEYYKSFFQQIPPGQGFDHNFCVIRGLQSGTSFVARALHAESGRVLEVYSNQPGVQFYTGGNFPSPCSKDPYKTDTEFPDGVSSSGFTSDDSFRGIGTNEEFEMDENEERIKKPLEYIPGKNGARYKKFGAFSVQPQNFPNAANFPHFPCSILRPGQIYYHDLTYKFGIQLGNYM